jgi:regulator of cell morphogenesis and NO signaling
MRARAEIDDRATLGELAAEQPARIELLERLRLDYCCGGSATLGDACRQRGLDVEAVREQLEAVDRDDLSLEASPEGDWRLAGIEELCEHIVSVHHDGLRRELPRISELLATVVRVHGGGHPELETVERTFASLRAELEEHIEDEERTVFPASRALARSEAVDLDPATVDRHVGEHEAVGRKLEALRTRAGGYDPSRALCSTHGALLEALRRFEADLHQHVHEENNVLFPRVGALLSPSPRPTLPPIPLCCQAWVAETSHALRSRRT